MLGFLDVVLFVLLIVLMAAILVARLQSMFVNPMMPRISMHDLHLRTGDLVFMNAHVGVSMFTAAWTHIGIVVADRLLEITPSTRRPVLVPLVPRITATLSTRDSAVCVRHVQGTVGRGRAIAAIRRVQGLRYEHTYWSVWMNHLLGWIVPVPDDRPGTTYCSDLVCRVAGYMGLMGHERCLPSDMVDDMWHSDAWGPAIRLTWSQTSA